MNETETSDRNHSTALPSDAKGLRCVDAHGNSWIDAMAGRLGPWGYGCEAVADAIRLAASDGVGSLFQGGKSPSAATQMLLGQLDGCGVRSCERAVLTSCRDTAVERAVLGARRLGSPTRYRTIALVGSDHGRSALCRTLSGSPELHQDLGPMMAGFAHVACGDLETLKRLVDDSAVAVVISPLAIHDAGKLLDASFLKKARSLCDDAGVVLIADETRVPYGSSGTWLMTPSIAGIELEAVILSAGLFSGLGGGVLVGSSDLIGSDEPGLPDGSLDGNLSLHDAVLRATLSAVGDHDWLANAMENHRQLAVELAEKLSEFEFVQDIQANGANVGIELDGPANELIEVAARENLRLESAGEHAVWMQLPLEISLADREELLVRFVTAIRSMARLASLSNI